MGTATPRKKTAKRVTDPPGPEETGQRQTIGPTEVTGPIRRSARIANLQRASQPVQATPASTSKGGKKANGSQPRQSRKVPTRTGSNQNDTAQNTNHSTVPPVPQKNAAQLKPNTEAENQQGGAPPQDILANRTHIPPDNDNHNKVEEYLNRQAEVGENLPPEVPPSESRSYPGIAPEIVEFYVSRGYQVPEEELMSPTTGPGSVQTGETKTRKPTLSVKAFSEALKDHKVDRSSTEDREMRALIAKFLCTSGIGHRSSVPVHEEVKNYMDSLWKLDMDKCFRSHEHVFQHTIMLAMISRLEFDDVLDYSCETTWRSNRFPGEGCANKPCIMSNPRPDLAIAFKTSTLLYNSRLPYDFARRVSLDSHVFPEGEDEDCGERAFHFFTMEVKGKLGANDNAKAKCQNLNNASQALYNIYLCMKEVGDLPTFFNEVRVFSVVATAHVFALRIHRAIPLAEDELSESPYRIRFAFEELFRKGEKYSREDGAGIVYSILQDYGVKKLHPIMKRTVKRLSRMANPRLVSPSPSASPPPSPPPPPPPPSDAGRNSQSSPRKRRAAEVADSFQSNRRSRRRRYSNSGSVSDS